MTPLPSIASNLLGNPSSGGHDFGRAEKRASSWALAPEVSRFSSDSIYEMSFVATDAVRNN
jgi:hypothetical protein